MRGGGIPSRFTRPRPMDARGVGDADPCGCIQQTLSKGRASSTARADFGCSRGTGDPSPTVGVCVFRGTGNPSPTMLVRIYGKKTPR